MGVTYIRRFRMELDFADVRLLQPSLPQGYHWIAWNSLTLDRHALVKFGSFQFEVDSRVFPCLGNIDGCQRLMYEITRQRTFLSGATWLITSETNEPGVPADCGTIQGLALTRSLGAVQNVGIVPEHRGYGLGRALVLKALHGFRNARLRRVYLEVTAENTPAVELYRSVGFRLARTMYKAVERETVPSY
jgi:predicted GNAT family N-acyltransferase